MNQDQSSVLRNNFWQDKIILLCLAILQAVLFWFALEHGYKNVLEALGVAGAAEVARNFNPFAFPLGTVAVAPFILYLNWDLWHTRARGILIGITVGTGALLLCLDVYGTWLELDRYELIEYRIFPAAALVFCLQPFFRMRLISQATLGQSSSQEASAGDTHSTFLPQGISLWLPSGQRYMQELLRAASLLLVTFIACMLTLFFLIICFKLVEGLFRFIENYGIISGLIDFFEEKLFIFLYAMVFTALFLSFLTRLRFLPFVILWMHRIAAWGFAPICILVILVLLALPLNIYAGGFEGSRLEEFLALEIAILIGLLFAATLRDYGPFASNIWGKIARIITIINPIIALALILPYLAQHYGAYLNKEDVLSLSLLAIFVPLALFFAVAVITKRLYGWSARYLSFTGLACALLILLLNSPILNPSRIAAASYSSYLLSPQYEHTDNMSDFSKLYNYYGKYGRLELEKLASLEGGGQKTQTLREMAAMSLKMAGAEGSSEKFTSAESEKVFASIAAWPKGKTVPKEIFAYIHISSFTLEDMKEEFACSQFFIMDFNNDSRDDILFFNGLDGTWTLWTARECIYDDGYPVCGDAIPPYEEERLKYPAPANSKPLERKMEWLYVGSGTVFKGDNSVVEIADICKELKLSIARDDVGFIAPIPKIMDLKVGDLRFNSGQ